MALKLSFKLNRCNYRGTLEEIESKINNDLSNRLNQLRIQYSRFYRPSKDSIKVIFPSEKEINKVTEKAEELKRHGFEPRVSMYTALVSTPPS